MPERGGTTASYYGHLTDATLCEAQAYAGYRVVDRKVVDDDHPQIAVVMRYVDDANMSQFRLDGERKAATLPF